MAAMGSAYTSSYFHDHSYVLDYQDHDQSVDPGSAAVNGTLDNITMFNDTDMSSYNGSILHLNLPYYMCVYVAVFNILIFVIGVVGNMMVIQVIVRMRAMRTRMNCLLLNLSVADLLVLTICQPTALMDFYSKEHWLIGSVMCKLVPFLEHATLHSSVLTLLLIGVERFMAFKHPLRTSGKHAFLSVWSVCGVIWTAACLLSLPFIVYTRLEKETFVDNSEGDTCRTILNTIYLKIYVVILFVVFFVLPMVILTFVYITIVQKLYKFTRRESVNIGHSPNPSCRSRILRQPCYKDRHIGTCNTKFQNRAIAFRRRVAVMMIALVGLFFVSILPLKSFVLWLTFASSTSKENLGFETYHNILSSARIATYVNSAGNPIIYALLSPKFRRAFRQLLSKCLSRPSRRHLSWAAYNGRYR